MKIKVNAYSVVPSYAEAGTAGSYGIEAMEFEFSPEWDGTTKTVTFFPPRGGAFCMPLTGNTLQLPSAVSAYPGQCPYTVCGTKAGSARLSLSAALVILPAEQADAQQIESEPGAIAAVTEALESARADALSASGASQSAHAAAAAAEQSAQEAHSDAERIGRGLEVANEAIAVLGGRKADKTELAELSTDLNDRINFVRTEYAGAVGRLVAAEADIETLGDELGARITALDESKADKSELAALSADVNDRIDSVRTDCAGAAGGLYVDESGHLASGDEKVRILCFDDGDYIQFGSGYIGDGLGSIDGFALCSNDGAISTAGCRITNMSDPVSDSDAATKEYVDSHGPAGIVKGSKETNGITIRWRMNGRVLQLGFDALSNLTSKSFTVSSALSAMWNEITPLGNLTEQRSYTVPVLDNDGTLGYFSVRADLSGRKLYVTASSLTLTSCTMTIVV